MHIRFSPQPSADRTPNIDRIGQEDMRFTDAYAQQSYTAGRAASSTEQSRKCTGLLKIGMPGDPILS